MRQNHKIHIVIILFFLSLVSLQAFAAPRSIGQRHLIDQILKDFRVKVPVSTQNELRPLLFSAVAVAYQSSYCIHPSITFTLPATPDSFIDVIIEDYEHSPIIVDINGAVFRIYPEHHNNCEYLGYLYPNYYILTYSVSPPMAFSNFVITTEAGLNQYDALNQQSGLEGEYQVITHVESETPCGILSSEHQLREPLKTHYKTGTHPAPIRLSDFMGSSGVRQKNKGRQQTVDDRTSITVLDREREKHIPRPDDITLPKKVPESDTKAMPHSPKTSGQVRQRPSNSRRKRQRTQLQQTFPVTYRASQALARSDDSIQNPAHSSEVIIPDAPTTANPPIAEVSALPDLPATDASHEETRRHGRSRQLWQPPDNGSCAECLMLCSLYIGPCWKSWLLATIDRFEQTALEVPASLPRLQLQLVYLKLVLNLYCMNTVASLRFGETSRSQVYQRLVQSDHALMKKLRSRDLLFKAGLVLSLGHWLEGKLVSGNSSNIDLVFAIHKNELVYEAVCPALRPISQIQNPQKLLEWLYQKDSGRPLPKQYRTLLRNSIEKSSVEFVQPGGESHKFVMCYHSNRLQKATRPQVVAALNAMGFGANLNQWIRHQAGAGLLRGDLATFSCLRSSCNDEVFYDLFHELVPETDSNPELTQLAHILDELAHITGTYASGYFTDAALSQCILNQYGYRAIELMLASLLFETELVVVIDTTMAAITTGRAPSCKTPWAQLSLGIMVTGNYGSAIETADYIQGDWLPESDNEHKAPATMKLITFDMRHFRRAVRKPEAQ
ncbi:hypothetical protein [Spongorhabdus nitratireducens]